MAKAKSIAKGTERSIPDDIELVLRSVLQLVEIAEANLACAELMLVRDKYIDPLELVACVLTNVSDELSRMSETVATIMVTLGGEPYEPQSENLVGVRLASAMDKAARKGRPKS